MSKRFVDTDLWQKEWFQDLDIKHKILVKYIFENCDCAGVWELNLRLASFIIGEKYSIDDLKAINEKKELFILFDDNKLFIKKFIEFQYGTLSENCKPHKPIIEKLKKYNLYERVSKGYAKVFENLEEKEKEKEKEIIIDNLIPIKKKIDPLTNPLIDKCFEVYKKKCPNLLKLGYEPKNAKTREELQEFLNEIDSNLDYFSELCEKANKLKEIVNKTIDFKMLIRNHIGIYNGKYKDNDTFDYNEWLKEQGNDTR